MSPSLVGNLFEPPSREGAVSIIASITQMGGQQRAPVQVCPKGQGGADCRLPKGAMRATTQKAPSFAQTHDEENICEGVW